MHYAVKSWNKLLSANTINLKSTNSLYHGAKPKDLEADFACVQTSAISFVARGKGTACNKGNRRRLHADKSRLGNWIMDSPCDNRRPVGRLDADTWWSETLTRYEIHPELKAGRSSWRICRHASHLFDLQEQLLSLNVKKNHRTAPLVGTLP